jgi:hypothetical protein
VPQRIVFVLEKTVFVPQMTASPPSSPPVPQQARHGITDVTYPSNTKNKPSLRKKKPRLGGKRTRPAHAGAAWTSASDCRIGRTGVRAAVECDKVVERWQGSSIVGDHDLADPDEEA